MQVGKNNKDIKFEEETEEPRLEKIVDLGLNFAKDTKSNTDEVVETIFQIFIKDDYVMTTF